MLPTNRITYHTIGHFSYVLRYKSLSSTLRKIFTEMKCCMLYLPKTVYRAPTKQKCLNMTTIGTTDGHLSMVSVNLPRNSQIRQPWRPLSTHRKSHLIGALEPKQLVPRTCNLFRKTRSLSWGNASEHFSFADSINPGEDDQDVGICPNRELVAYTVACFPENCGQISQVVIKS